MPRSRPGRANAHRSKMKFSRRPLLTSSGARWNKPTGAAKCSTSGASLSRHERCIVRRPRPGRWLSSDGTSNRCQSCRCPLAVDRYVRLRPERRLGPQGKTRTRCRSGVRISVYNGRFISGSCDIFATTQLRVYMYHLTIDLRHHCRRSCMRCFSTVVALRLRALHFVASRESPCPPAISRMESTAA